MLYSSVKKVTFLFLNANKKRPFIITQGSAIQQHLASYSKSIHTNNDTSGSEYLKANV